MWLARVLAPLPSSLVVFRGLVAGRGHFQKDATIRPSNTGPRNRPHNTNYEPCSRSGESQRQGPGRNQVSLPDGIWH